MTTQIITMFYDDYERFYGDGFYPMLNDSFGYTNINIEFKQDPDNYWRQVDNNNSCINGLDGDNGKLLFQLLNTMANISTCNGIKNCAGKILYPK
jgi:hypothetical protein